MKAMRFIRFVYILPLIFLQIVTVISRNHHLELTNDVRNYFRISSFGFLAGGKLEVHLQSLSFSPNYNPKLGLTLAKTVSDAIVPYMETQNDCFLADDAITTDENVQIVTFLFNLKNNELLVNCSAVLPSLEIKPYFTDSENLQISEEISHHISKVPNMIKQKHSIDENDTIKENPENKLLNHESETKETESPSEFETSIEEKQGTGIKVNSPNICDSFKISFKRKYFHELIEQRRMITDLKFIINMKNEDAVGFYSLYFHNCGINDQLVLPVNLKIAIIESNGKNYLSAGKIPLPKLYFMMSFIFFILGCVWIGVLERKKEQTFKIHYLMCLLVFLKSLSLLFHGINYYIIAREGSPIEAWAILYYITQLLKGPLLFITIVLIGAGLGFIKGNLSCKVKVILMIVIPLQVLANIAKIIIEESDEGQSIYYTWKEVLILVDLICCGAILFPVVWSVRLLKNTSQTDGKATVNFGKLKLFRNFYVMIVLYIYCTRIITYLLKITMTFHYEWVNELFREAATFTFFVVTGIKFQPTISNSYFRLPQDDDMKMDEVITQIGFTNNFSRTVISKENSNPNEEGMTTKCESSHK